MCVIAAKPAGVKWLSEKEMKSCFTSNSNGAGIAWYEDGKVWIKKGYFKWKTLWQDLKKYEECPVLLHCRLATHGSISTKNCHPFALTNGLVMAHNGIISIDPLEKDMTDSESFGKKYISRFSARQIKTPAVKELLEQAIGAGKIALLEQNGKFIILNEGYGLEHEGIWFSNDSFKPREKIVYQFPTTFRWEDNYWERPYMSQKYPSSTGNKKEHAKCSVCGFLDDKIYMNEIHGKYVCSECFAVMDDDDIGFLADEKESKDEFIECDYCGANLKSKEAINYGGFLLCPSCYQEVAESDEECRQFFGKSTPVEKIA